MRIIILIKFLTVFKIWESVKIGINLVIFVGLIGNATIIFCVRGRIWPKFAIEGEIYSHKYS